MEKHLVFKGAATALVTPFRNGAIDFCAFEKLIEFQIAEHADALVVCGTTGEVSTLTTAERKACMQFAVRTVRGRVPVIIGTGCNDTEYSIQLSRYAEACGADALLLVTPYYNKTTQEGLVRHYTAIADAVSLPVILYNVPSRTGLSIAADTYTTLAAHPRIVAVKEASGNFSTIAKTAATCKNTLNIYSGNDDQTLPILSLGGVGVISVLGNLLPREMHDLCALYFAGKTEASTILQHKLIPLAEALFAEVNPTPVKAALAMCGRCAEDVRLPLCPPSAETRAKLRTALNEWGLL